MFMLRPYTHDQLTKDIGLIEKFYPFLDISSVGESIEKRPIYIIRLGTGEREVFFNASHHALEWITSLIIMNFIFDYGDHYILGSRLSGFNIRHLAKISSIYMLPMVNPDGVERVISYGSKFSTWQANARGVDLNHNYDADWDLCHERELASGILGPGPSRYGGTHAESEPETKAIVDFVRAHSFKRVVALHSQGNEIYWNFKNLEPSCSFSFAETLSKASGYTVSTPPTSASAGGFKDWFIKEFRHEGYTFEVGKGKNPLPLEQYPKIYEDILEILLLCAI